MDKENQSESENSMYQTSDGSFVSIECLVVLWGSASADLTRSQLTEITFTVDIGRRSSSAPSKTGSSALSSSRSEALDLLQTQ